MPPRPLFHGSRTASAKAVATTASTAEPPAARISAPTPAATPFCEATMPPRETATGFRTTQFCMSCGISDHLDRINPVWIEGVMAGQPLGLVIGRPVTPDRVFGTLLAAVDHQGPIRAIALERAIGLVVGRPHQLEPHILFRNVMHRPMAGLLAADRAGAVGHDLTGKSHANAPGFGQQIDAVFGLVLIARGGVCHGSALPAQRIVSEGGALLER